MHKRSKLLPEPFIERGHTCLYMRFPLNDGSGVLHLTDTHFTMALREYIHIYMYMLCI